MVRKTGGCGDGAAMDSVRSSTSAMPSSGAMPLVLVPASRPASMASMSSWLVAGGGGTVTIASGGIGGALVAMAFALFGVALLEERSDRNGHDEEKIDADEESLAGLTAL